MKNYKILWGMIIILILISAALSITIIQNFNQLAKARAESNVLSESLSSMESEFDSSQEKLRQAESKLSNCENKLRTSKDATQASEQSLRELTETSQERIENLDSQLSSSRNQLASTLKRVGELEEIEDKYNQVICDPNLMEQLKMDYSGIQASSSRLQGFVSTLPDVDHISWAYRTTIWNNTDSKVHGVRYVSEDGNAYSHQYLVYVKEFGWDEATFDIGGQCWLDPPW